MLLEFAESGHPTFCATTPLSRGILKSKGHGKLSIHFAADELTIETIFRIIISDNQLNIYGAVAAICEEFESHQDGSGEPDVLMGQSIVLGEIKAEIPLQNENFSNRQILWQQYKERIESLSPECKVSRFCMEAGFIRVVEVGQYFMIKDTGDFSSWCCINEHVGNLDFLQELQELFLRILHDSLDRLHRQKGKGHQRHTIRPLYTQLARPGRRTFDQDLWCRRCDS